MSNLNTVVYDPTTKLVATNSTASLALTASAMPATMPYTTITTSSTNWITASILVPEQYVSVTTPLLYNFTCSGIPTSGQVGGTVLYINNTAAATSSLAFPTTWKFLGVAPTYITASKVAVLSLKAYGDGTVLASMTSQY